MSYPIVYHLLVGIKLMVFLIVGIGALVSFDTLRRWWSKNHD